ncbi:potassium/sodium hyperpolarization-activated cyclic nucleotide-gated channel 4-like [Manacus candei]|uniref:potassium/sodium hyperpolarization-activated cyclic nucleotide-gated channel 4-like n=1 Tax=Manacus candei TaxID=415023 RepID=UPI002226BE0C|nr:potassium/sodium hyperpolarization-activated cyclic nucleotide-gated channel 4-like [Manacus candei]
MLSLPVREERDRSCSIMPRTGSRPREEGAMEGDRPCRAPASPHPLPVRASSSRLRAKDNSGNPSPSRGTGGPCLPWSRSRGAPSRGPIPGGQRTPCCPALMALLLGAVLLAAGAAIPPGMPAPRDLARSVLETHGQDLRLLKLLGVTRTSFDWGTHFSINFTARQPPCPKPAPDPRGCRGRPGRVQRCSAQVSVFTFLPDVPLSMVECGEEPQPGGSAQPRSPGNPKTFSANPGHSSSSSSSSSRPPPRPRPPSASPRGSSRRPPAPTELE